MGNADLNVQLFSKFVLDLHRVHPALTSFALLPMVAMEADPLFCQPVKWFHPDLKGVKAAIELIQSAKGSAIESISQLVQLVEAKIFWPTSSHLLIQSPIAGKESAAGEVRNCIVLFPGGNSVFASEAVESWKSRFKNSVSKVLLIEDEKPFLMQCTSEQVNCKESKVVSSIGIDTIENNSSLLNEPSHSEPPHSFPIPFILSLFCDAVPDLFSSVEVPAAIPTDFSSANAKIDILPEQKFEFKCSIPRNAQHASVSLLAPPQPLPSFIEETHAEVPCLSWKDLLQLSSEEALQHLPNDLSLPNMQEIEAKAHEICNLESPSQHVSVDESQVKSFLAQVHLLKEGTGSNPAVVHFLELYFCCCASTEESTAFSRSLHRIFGLDTGKELEKMLQLTCEMLNSPLKQQQQNSSKRRIEETLISKPQVVPAFNREILLSPTSAAGCRERGRTKGHPVKAIPQTEVVVKATGLPKERVIPETPFLPSKRNQSLKTPTGKNELGEEAEISITETPRKLLSCRRRLAL